MKLIMKGNKIKCGLLLALFIMLGLSLGISSGDTNALKYSFNTFPLYQARYSDTSSPGGEAFGFWFDTNNSSDLSVSDEILSTNSSYYYETYLSNNVCLNRDYKSNIFSNSIVSSRNYTDIWSGEGTGFYRTFGFDDCEHNVTKYSYDSFFGNTYYLSNGEVEKVVDIDKELFSSSSNEERYLKRVTIPLNFDSSVSFSANTPLSFSFGLVTSYPTGFSNFTVPNVSFDVYYSSEGSSYHEIISSCSVNDNYGFATVNPDLSVSGAYSGFLVTCDFTPTRDISHFTSRLIIFGGSADYNPSSFLSYFSNYGLYFASSYLVTENDNTWSGQNISPLPTGENINDAPGYTQLYGVDSPTCVPGDFLCQLGNLFTFNFINPFAPIFNLFGNNESCAQIPNLASMIHSEETQVCPWFNATTRNIVTPVLGLSSMMLVFGFAVRWLGARSGNFIEDSGGVDSGGYHFENKYRRRK